jgi:hypothetical protein
MGILHVKEPVWNPNTREWIVDYTVKDGDIEYVQRARCEALVSAEKLIQRINQQIK